ncbi:MAG: hypothetical protein JM58_09515 [Peptococcaceae bacterium BICA1-8]|nr:MAG: hypothetical protein JM58_09515 [Peptococcaceae bacterium BICA1-8]
MKELKGSEKQIAWAEKIRENLIEQVNDKSVPQIYHLFNTNTPKVHKFINELKNLRTENEYLNNQIVVRKIQLLIEDEENAVTFIDNQSLMSFLRTIIK